MAYFITPNYSIALNTKVGSSSLSLAVIIAYDLERWQLIQNGAYPPGVGYKDMRWHPLAKKERTATKPVILPVRDPVDRFCSACAQINVGRENVNKVLDSLETGEIFTRANERSVNVQRNEHFTFQHRLAVGTTHLFKFPDHLNELGTLAGLVLPLPIINESGTRPKPVLTNVQTRRVQEYYREDIDLFNSIIAPNTIIVVEPPEPAEVDVFNEEISIVDLRLALLKEGVTTSDVQSALSVIADPAVKEEISIILNYGSTIKRNQAGLSELAVLLGIPKNEIKRAFKKKLKAAVE